MHDDVYMYMYCISICVYTYIYIYTHTFIYIYIYIRTHGCIHMFCVHMHMYVHVHRCLFVCITYEYIYMYAHMPISTTAMLNQSLRLRVHRVELHMQSATTFDRGIFQPTSGTCGLGFRTYGVKCGRV